MIKLKNILNEIESNDKPKYCGIVISKESKDLLLDKFGNRIPDGWDIIAHHMTIDPFKKCEDSKYCDVSNINEEYELTITEFGIDDKACAVKVDYAHKTRNDFPHITLAVDGENGGKPFHSNKIPQDNWEKIEEEIKVKGKVQTI